MARKRDPKGGAFPRLPRKKGQRGNTEVDVEKLKALYLEGGHYAWSDFCRAHGFPAASQTNPWFREKIDWTGWKREWVRQRNIVTEEALTPDLISAQRLIAESRIRFVKDYSAIAKNMKALLSHLMREHVMHAAHDQQHENLITMGARKKKLVLDADELSKLASAGNRIAELEARALLIIAGDRNLASRSMAEVSEVEAEDKGSDEIPTYTFNTIGTSMTAQERTEMLAGYFDQFAGPPQPVPALPSLDDAQDQG